MRSLFRYPSGWLPLALSLGMLGVFSLYLGGVIAPDQSGDEGMAAHLFQIWLVAEGFTILLFGLKWLGSRPKDAILVLAVQIGVVIALMSPIFYLHL